MDPTVVRQAESVTIRRFVEMTPAWTMVARAMLDTAVCACGNLATRLTIDAIPSDARKRKARLVESRNHDTVRVYGETIQDTPTVRDWTLRVRTWCGRTDDEHTEGLAAESAMTEEDLQ